MFKKIGRTLRSAVRSPEPQKIRLIGALKGANGAANHTRYCGAFLKKVFARHDFAVQRRIEPDACDLLISNHFLDLCQGRLRAKRTVQILHNSYPFFLEKGVSDEQMRTSLHRCERLVFISRNVMRDYAGRYDLPPAKCFFVPNISVMEDRYRPRDRSGSPKRAVMVASIQKRKGFEVILEKGLGDLTLDVYGPTQDKELAQTLERASGIELKGIIDHEQMADILPSYDFMILPSFQEGCPGTLIEAISLGLPCFCSDVNGSPEVVLDDVNGNTFNHEKNDFRQRLAYFLSRDMNRYSAAGRRHYEQTFSQARFEAAMRVAFEDLVPGDLRGRLRKQIEHLIHH